MDGVYYGYFNDLIILVYTYAYNWVYDRVRLFFVKA